MHNKLNVFTTSRGKRDYLVQNLSSKVLTIDEFFKRVYYIENKTLIDSDTRSLLLKEASEFSDFSHLNIPNDFFKFLESSSFILRFFDELSLEKVEIEALALNDTYAMYDDHLKILKTLKEYYIRLLDKYNFYDILTATKNYKINNGYIQQFQEIEIFYEGYLNNFEYEILNKISKIVDLKINLIFTPFCGKFISKFSQEFGLKLNQKYTLDLTNNKICENKSIFFSNTIRVEKVKQRTHQIGVIKKEINNLVTKGNIKPEDIYILLPDESFTEFFLLYDYENNFNIAKGISFQKTVVFEILKAIYDRHIFQNNFNHSFYQRLQKSYNFDDEISAILDEFITLEDFEKKIEYFLMFIKENEEKQIFIEELFSLKKLLSVLPNFKTKEALKLLLSKLQEKNLSHKNGGKITVLGLLETRELNSKFLIIVDFNDGFAPKESVKDLFINSAVKKYAGLPTRKDRQNFQKAHYYRAISQAKNVLILYTENENYLVSRFLKELSINEINSFYSYKVDNLLIKKGKTFSHINSDIICDIDLTQNKLSSSKFSTYLRCRRKFYYKYVLNLYEPKIDENIIDARFVGNIIHSVLFKLYEQNSYLDIKDLKKRFNEILKTEQKNLVSYFELEVYSNKMQTFFKNEIQHFLDGWIVKYRELKFTKNIDNILFEGTIDRIDYNQDLNQYAIIDYKTGSINKDPKDLNNLTDFQMVFYKLLSQSSSGIDNISYCALYDLKNAKLIKDNNLDEKTEILFNKLNEYKNRSQNFVMCEQKSECVYCPYKIMCDR